MDIRSYQASDEDAVIALWDACGLIRPWNDPHRDIARKCQVQPESFLVGTHKGEVVATIMVGYDGHRGWVYYLAVDRAHRNVGAGRKLMQHAESLLLAQGCPKINLQVRTSNAEVLAFYAALGYVRDDAVSLGKRLIKDD